MAAVPKVNQRWQYKQNRGVGRFMIVKVTEDRVTLRNWRGKDKTISLRTLRGDYEQIEAV